MKKSVTLLFFAFFSIAISHPIFAQTPPPTSCRTVLANGGGEATTAGLQFQHTLGESVIASIGNGDKILSQGFQQPEICPLTVGTKELPANAGVLVYPNPTTAFVHVQFKKPTGQMLQFFVFDMSGKKLFDSEILSDTALITVNFQSWPSGTYSLRAQSLDGHFIFQVQVIKNAP